MELHFKYLQKKSVVDEKIEREKQVRSRLFVLRIFSKLSTIYSIAAYYRMVVSTLAAIIYSISQNDATYCLIRWVLVKKNNGLGELRVWVKVAVLRSVYRDRFPNLTTTLTQNINP